MTTRWPPSAYLWLSELAKRSREQSQRAVSTAVGKVRPGLRAKSEATKLTFDPVALCSLPLALCSLPLAPLASSRLSRSDHGRGLVGPSVSPEMFRSPQLPTCFHCANEHAPRVSTSLHCLLDPRSAQRSRMDSPLNVRQNVVHQTAKMRW